MHLWVLLHCCHSSVTSLSFYFLWKSENRIITVRFFKYPWFFFCYYYLISDSSWQNNLVYSLCSWIHLCKWFKLFFRVLEKFSSYWNHAYPSIGFLLFPCLLFRCIPCILANMSDVVLHVACKLQTWRPATWHYPLCSSCCFIQELCDNECIAWWMT